MQGRAVGRYAATFNLFPYRHDIRHELRAVLRDPVLLSNEMERYPFEIQPPRQAWHIPADIAQFLALAVGIDQNGRGHGRHAVHLMTFST